MRMQLGDWQLDTVNGGYFRLDGGVMFGVVPRVLWQNVVRPDDQNRIPCANHCVLARDGNRTVLIDTGYGGKHATLERKFYGMEPGEPLLESLTRLGVEPAEIDLVVFSHLHFDHVCGATRWGADGQRTLTFPRARHIVGRWEWEDAISGAPGLESTYPRDDIMPLYEAGQLHVVEDGQQIVPGLRASVTGGHTRGHLALVFESAGQTAIYLGDICPSTAHLRQMWHLAYDLYPLVTRQRKQQLLGEAADRRWWILWNHDPLVAVSRVVRDAKREFVAVETQPRL
jgi:glyoxylase-like metal-dependent hydrolase (beta-lactamase superfamily II)